MRRARDRWMAYAFVTPAVLLVGVLMYYPMLATFWESLFTTSFIDPEPQFVGLQTYAQILGDGSFFTVVLNSVFWTGGVVIGQNLLGFFAALLLNQRLPGQGMLRAIVLLPWVVPGVVTAILWRFLYDPQLGLINSFLIGWGLTDAPVAWLGDTGTAMLAAVIAAIWKGFPFSTVIFLAALQSVDREQLEAAKVDGAGPVRRLIDIIVPSVAHVIVINLLLTTILTFNYFDMIWVMTRGGPLDATHIFPTRIFEIGFGQFRFGEAAAYGALSVIILAGFVVSFFVLQRRYAERD